MDSPEVQREEPTPIQLHAINNITYIRNAMDRSSEFTGVPGWGMVIVGGLATLGSYVATLRLSPLWWFNVWIAVGMISMAIGMVALYVKAARLETSVFSASGRRFLACFVPAIAVGMVLTDTFFWTGAQHLLVPMWLMMYGVAVIGGGVYSIPAVPALGAFMLLLGGVSAQVDGPRLIGVLEYTVNDAFMVTGFGFAHIVAGLVIAVRHGG